MRLEHHRPRQSLSSSIGSGGGSPLSFRDVEMQLEEDLQPEESCCRQVGRAAAKLVFVNLVVMGAGGFFLGGAAGGMTAVGLSWLKHNTMYPINYSVALGIAKIGSCIGVAVKTINGLYRAPYVGVFDRKVSFCSYFSRLCGGS